MIRMNVAWWCQVAASLSDLAAVHAGDPFPEFYLKAYPALGRILANYADGTLIRLYTSAGSALQVMEILQRIWIDKSRTEPITSDEAAKLQTAVRNYQTILEAELGTIDAYYVRQKGIFSTRYLTENADSVIPADMHRYLAEEAKTDLQAAGKCLAFELPTAAGFHVARATESVIRWFMNTIGCPIPKDSQRNWGAYIKALREKQADAKITHHILSRQKIYTETR